jgi:membrane-bound serine protease (ClpP class)
VGFGAVSFGLAWLALKARRNKRLTGPQALLGSEAIALTPLAPTGQVEVRGEIWKATLTAGAEPVTAGTHVIVRTIDGLTLTVEPLVGMDWKRI